MSDPFQAPAPPPGGPPLRSTPLGQSQPFGAPAPGGIPGYGQAPIAQPQWAQPAGQQRGTNGLAVAGFVLGLLWLCTLGSILGIVFGFVALSQIKRTNQGGRGLAIAGIVLGIVGIILTVVLWLVVWDTAEEVLEMEAGERDDVEVVGCEVGAGGRAEATLEITNDSSRTSAYIITMEFSSSGETVETGVSGVDLVAPGETVTQTVQASGDLPSGDVRCDVSYVNRFASGSNDNG